MLLSIIIPVYNEEENLMVRLAHLSEQAAKYPIEVIVSNSPDTTDQTEAVCNKYTKVQFHQSLERGRAKQMNFGAQQASGDVFLFLHADVMLPEDFYVQIKETMQRYKAGFFAYQFDTPTTLLNINSKFTTRDGFFAGGGDQCQFFTKQLFNSLGGFNEDFCIMEDFEMIDRLRKHRIPYNIVQSKATVSARKYEQNSWLKVNLINGYIFLRYKLGTKPEKLRRLYKSLLREGV